MTAHLTHSTSVPWHIARIAVALAIATGSFVALRFAYHGACAPQKYHEGDIWFIVLPIFFLIGFIWLGLELLRLRWPMALLETQLLGLLVSSLLYGALGATVYIGNPGKDAHTSSLESEMRGRYSFFWSVGLLQETGNFWTPSCWDGD